VFKERSMIAVDKHAPTVRSHDGAPVDREFEGLAAAVRNAVREQLIWDVHTHLYPPTFGTPFCGSAPSADPKGLLLWGIDELLTYHYLVAEVFRAVPAKQLPYEAFWKMTKRQQADHIWKHLFVECSPVSEACRCSGWDSTRRPVISTAIAAGSPSKTPIGTSTASWKSPASRGSP
jgi:hypothetical protein